MIARNQDLSHNTRGLVYTPLLSTMSVFYPNIFLPMYLPLSQGLLIGMYYVIRSAK